MNRCVAIVAVCLVLPFAVRAADNTDGTWIPTEGKVGTMDLPAELLKSIVLKVDGAKYEVIAGEEKETGTVKYDAKKTPATMDIEAADGPNKGKKILAIYEVKGDVLKVCYNLSGGPERPTDFKPTEKNGFGLIVYKRKK